MSTQPTQYAVRRTDGRYLLLIKTVGSVIHQTATWTSDLNLATRFPFMTSANLTMGLDQDPCLQVERDGWDVIAVEDAPVPHVLKFSVPMVAVLLCVLSLFANSVSAQSLKLPLVTLSVLRAADATTTLDLASRYGGRELNPFMPQNPKLIAALLAGETAGQAWALVKVGKAHPKIAAVLAWASIGIEGFVVVHNVRQYRGR